MSNIAQAEIDYIKQNTSLVELVRSFGVKLKKSGKEYLGLCPFHKDTKASLCVSPTNNLYHCKGNCEAAGDVFSWVMQIRQIKFPEAFKLLKEQFPILSTSPKKSTSSKKQKTSPNLPVALDADKQTALNQAVDYYHKRLKENRHALEYLGKRGINSPQAVEKFKIGFSDKTLGSFLPNKGRKNGQIRETLQQVGIFRKSGHEHFAGSIVIPIFDNEGNVSEIYGRKIHDNLRLGTIYHLYLPGPHRGIFNSDCLKMGGEIILCEAILDALSFWIYGHKNVTASFGVSGFTKEMLEAFIHDKVSKVYIAYDKDEAGDNKALKLAETLIPLSITCFRIHFPYTLDANAYISKPEITKAELKNLLNNAENMDKYFSSLAATNPPTNTKKAAKEEKQSVIEKPLLETLQTPEKDNQQAAKKENTPQDADKKEKITIPAKYQIEATMKGEVVEIQLAERLYKIRGLQKNLSFDSLRVSIRVYQQGRFHIDTLELFNARARATFVRTVATELNIKPEIIKYEVDRILLKLEQIQEKLIQQQLHPEAQKVVISEKERKEAIEYFKNPKLLDQIGKDFEHCGLVGERTNCLICYLAMTSRKLDDPLAVIIQALSGCGKSALMNAALEFFPKEEIVKYSALTAQALFYMNENALVHKILAISEEKGAELASYSIKLLQSEKHLSIASTGKNAKSGRFSTQEYHVKGPSATLFSTTNEEVDEELQNRCLVTTTCSSQEQTEAIQALQREGQTLNGILKAQDKNHIIKLHQNAQRLLKPLKVVNPYAHKLTFISHNVRTRRDHGKYLGLIQAIAFLHQFQREIKQVKHRGQTIEYIEVQPSDIAAANSIICETMGISLDELAPQTRKFLELLVEMSKKHQKQEPKEAEPKPKIPLFTKRQIREYTGWSVMQVRTHLRRLVELEYVQIHGSKSGQTFLYGLLYKEEGKDNNKFIMGLIDPDKLD